MSEFRGSTWGPLPLPEFLTAQLEDHGFSPDDAAKCAADIRNVAGRAAAASLFVDLGSCKFLEGDIDGAVAAWRQAITSDHDAAAARALLNMGLMYEHLHLYARALPVLRSVADRSVAPHEVQAALAVARCQVAIGDADTAIETVAMLASSTMAERPEAPEISEIMLALGDLANDAGRPDRAERSWRVAVAGPDSPARQAAHDRLLKLSLDQGHDDEFVELLASGDSQQPPAAEMLDRVDSLVRLGQTERAIELLESIEDNAFTNAERFRVAELRVHVGQVNRGIDHYEELLGSPLPEVWQRAAYALGTLYLGYEMPDVAASMFDRVRSHQDHYWAPKAALARGDIHAKAGEHELAAGLWDDARASNVAAVRANAHSRLDGGLPVERAESASAGEAVVVDLNELSIDTPEAAASALGSEIGARTDDEAGDAQIIDLKSLSDAGSAEPGDLQAPLDSGVDAAVTDPPAVELEPEVIVLVDNESQELPAVALVEPADPPSADLSAEPAEPVVIVLESVEDLSAGDAAATPASSIFARLSDRDEVYEESDEVAGDVASYPDASNDALPDEPAGNPYASLAPEGLAPIISNSNPYAELAPSYDGDDFALDDDVEPGDWESMLEERTAPPAPTGGRGLRRRPSTFSRYT